jgi:hypothetical protein
LVDQLQQNSFQQPQNPFQPQNTFQQNNSNPFQNNSNPFQSNHITPFQQPSNPFQQPSNPFQQPTSPSNFNSNPFQQNQTPFNSNWLPRSTPLNLNTPTPFNFRRSNNLFSTKNSKSNKTSRDVGRFNKFSRRKSRYNISDDESECENLTDGQKRTVMQMIEECCPSSMTQAIKQNIFDQMDRLDKKGFRIPKGYDRTKHDIDENERMLFDQQVEQEKDLEKNKVKNLIGFAASALKFVCKGFNIDIINTDEVPSVINEALENHEFDDSLDGIGTLIRGTVLENPVISACYTFAKKIEEAQDKAEEKKEQRFENHERFEKATKKSSLSSLNKISKDENPFNLPTPKASKVEKQEVSEKKKS